MYHDIVLCSYNHFMKPRTAHKQWAGYLRWLLLIFLILPAACIRPQNIPTLIPIQNPAESTPLQIPTRVTRTPTSSPVATATQPWLPGLQEIGPENLLQLVELRSLPGYTPALAISEDGLWLAAGSLERVLYLWNLSDGSVRSAEIEANPDTIWALAFSPDDKMLAMGSGDSQIRLWSVPDLTLMHTLEDHLYDVRCLDFSPDGRYLLSGSQDQTIRRWDLQEDSVLTFRWNPGYVRAVRYSPDGSRIASASGEGTLRLWGAEGELLYDLRLWDEREQLLPDVRLNQDDMTSVAFSPDGSMLAAAGQNRFLWLFSVPDFRRLGGFEAHKTDINTLAFSPDGRLMVSGSEDGSMKFWQVSPESDPVLQEIKAFFPRPGYRVSALLFRRDSRMMVSASLNDRIILWGVPAE